MFLKNKLKVKWKCVDRYLHGRRQVGNDFQKDRCIAWRKCIQNKNKDKMLQHRDNLSNHFQKIERCKNKIK
jgi:hypothetical protein